MKLNALLNTSRLNISRIYKSKIYKYLAFCLPALPVAVTAQTIDLYPDTWVAIDGYERVMPTAQEEPLRTDKERTVGIFYVSWHWDFFYNQFQNPYRADVTQILEKDPEARLSYDHPLWTPHEYSYHWGEPELGYFTSGDSYVVRKDISMLTDAGVDVLILDVTNAVTYFDAWDVLFETMEEMKAEGNKVPKICFWGFNGAVAARLLEVYNYYYKRGKYQDLWFYWDGKPLMLYNRDAKYAQEIYDFFTLRNMWWGYAYWNGYKYLGTEDSWSFGLDMHDSAVRNMTPEERVSRHNGRLEEIAVTPAQHSATMVGKSWTLRSGEPSLNKYDLPNRKFLNKKWIDHPEGCGFYFQERWDEALSADPDFIYLNDWNEWTAGQFPGNVTFMNRQSDYHFVDQYNAEFNRTIQPMKGGYTDNYYMQMVQNIRRYKGVRQAPKALEQKDVDIYSPMDAWDKIEEEFLDTPGDVTHRNHTGYGGNIYTNTSGRNDILRSKVSVGADKITFYAETAAEITDAKGPNWMLLFLNTDCDYSTGWEGFDFAVNTLVFNNNKTRLAAWDKEGQCWKHVAMVDYRLEGNHLVIEVPMEHLEITEAMRGNFYFKWADNPADLKDAISLCVNGDTAPNRRFCYNYRWDFFEAALGEVQTEGTDLKVTPVPGNMLRVQCKGQFQVYNLVGQQVVSGTGYSTQTMPAPGYYIVRAGSQAVKVYL